MGGGGGSERTQHCKPASHSVVDRCVYTVYIMQGFEPLHDVHCIYFCMFYIICK